jgi:hypothetical protein
VGLELHLFEVENDVCNILNDVWKGLEFVVGTLDFDRGDGCALKGGKQHSTKRVANRVTVTGLKGFRDEARVSVCARGLIFDKRGWHFKSTETNWHIIEGRLSGFGF